MSDQPLDVELSTTPYAQRTKSLMELDRKLKDLGVSADFDWPTIVVIGGQSAGKSSLVESITGIRVPRDSGTCTRCPMECTIKGIPGAEWSCQVSLRFDFDDSTGKRLSGSRPIPFGPLLTDPFAVEDTLRKAQLAVLNPGMDAATFFHLDDDGIDHQKKSSTKEFSANVVTIDVIVSDSASLSFVDLPGLVGGAVDDTRNFVENLVRRQIGKESIILCTIPMPDDMENQRAVRLAHEADQEHARTIGVLTKPDMVPGGSLSKLKNWCDVIDGREYKQEHGYFCVRLPDDKERSLSLSGAETRVRERQFFEDTSPWNECANRHRFGIQNLVSYLSKVLGNMIDDVLPTFKAVVEAQLQRCEAALQALPEPPGVDATAEVLALISELCRDMHDRVYGATSGPPESRKFIQENRAAYRRLKQAFARSVPDFRPFERPQDYRGLVQASELPLNVTIPEIDIIPGDDSVPMGLRDIRNVIEESITWELPNNVPYEAKRQLISKFVDAWSAPSTRCFDDVARRLQVLLQARVQHHFQRFPKLRAVVETFIVEKLQEDKANAQQSLRGTLHSESNPLYTQNNQYFHSIRQEWLGFYKDARQHPERYNILPLQETDTPIYGIGPSNPAITVSVNRPINQVESEVLRGLTILGYGNVTKSALARLYPADEYEDELIVMADVRAYFEVAYKRVADNIPLVIEHALNQHLVNTLPKVLMTQLEIGSPHGAESLAKMLAEEPGIVEQRRELTDRKTRLQSILHELRIFGV